MTLENAKRLYKHFLEKGMLKEAEDIAKWRPEVKSVKAEPEKPKSKKK